MLYKDVVSEVSTLAKNSNGVARMYKATSGKEHGDVEIYAVEVSAINSTTCAARMMVVCGQHAREVVTVHVCLRFLEKLLSGKSKHSAMVKRGEASVMVVMSANPRGMDIALTVNPCLRRNPRGVDLNRNWPRVSDMDVRFSREENPGSVALSEFENKFIESLIHSPASKHSFHPDVLVNVHTGERMILYPYDGAYGDVPLKLTHHTLAEAVKHKFCPECKVGSGLRTLYPSAGTMCDWAISRANVSLAYTWEIYADEPSSAGMKGCIKKFNPNTTQTATDVIDTWSQALLYTLELSEKLCHSKDSVIPRFSDRKCMG